MGTNYYVETTTHGELHFGKSSRGWVFGIHIHPHLGLNTFEDWIMLLTDKEVVSAIRDEYSRPVPLEELIHTVAGRRGRIDHETGKALAREQDCEYLEEYRLLRQKSRYGCTHGAGTWNYNDYDFC